MRVSVLIALASASVIANANAQGIYKCISKEGRTTYSNTSCPGAKELKSAQFDARRLSERDANLAYECSDALHYLLLDPKTTSSAIVSQLGKFRQQFDNFCPRFGYKPFSADTAQFDEEHRVKLSKILKESHPDAPSGTRVYDHRGRQPPLFSEY